MKPNTPEEAIELERARVAGKLIQCNALCNPDHPTDGWMDCESSLFYFASFRYRVKPEPPRIFWINEYCNGQFCIHKSLAEAQASDPARKACFKVVEVLE